MPWFSLDVHAPAPASAPSRIPTDLLALLRSLGLEDEAAVLRAVQVKFVRV